MIQGFIDICIPLPSREGKIASNQRVSIQKFLICSEASLHFPNSELKSPPITSGLSQYFNPHDQISCKTSSKMPKRLVVQLHGKYVDIYNKQISTTIIRLI